MRTHADKISGSRPAARKRQQAQLFTDRRREALTHQSVRQMADNSPRSQQLKSLQQTAQRKTPVNDDRQLEQEADVMGKKALQIRSSDAGPALQRKAIGDPVVQRQLSWVEGGRTRNKDLTRTLMNFEDFGITPAILNAAELPRDNDMNGVLTAPAFMMEPKQNGKMELSVFSEPVNRVGYRMELPAPPPWQAQSTVTTVDGRLGILGHGLEDDVKPPGAEAVDVNIHGLPDDHTFASLVELHEEFHVKEVQRITDQILVPWDHRIGLFKQQQRTIAGDDATDAKAKFYEAIGGTPLQVANRFRDALSISGRDFHRTQEGSSPTLEMKGFKRQNQPPHTLRVYWKHPLG